MCISVCLTTNPVYIEQLTEMVPPPSQNTVVVCKQMPLHIPYYISSWLVTLIKISDAPIQVTCCHNFVLS
jgi:hypothetical protein